MPGTEVAEAHFPDVLVREQGVQLMLHHLNKHTAAGLAGNTVTNATGLRVHQDYTTMTSIHCERQCKSLWKSQDKQCPTAHSMMRFYKISDDRTKVIVAVLSTHSESQTSLGNKNLVRLNITSH